MASFFLPGYRKKSTMGGMGLFEWWVSLNALVLWVCVLVLLHAERTKRSWVKRKVEGGRDPRPWEYDRLDRRERGAWEWGTLASCLALLGCLLKAVGWAMGRIEG